MGSAWRIQAVAAFDISAKLLIPSSLARALTEPSRAGFQQTILRFHIHTVINLRGADPRQPWYEDELAAARVSGAQHIDLRMSATHMPSPATLDELRAILNHATLPILIHCQSGADRSGLVAALYELWVVHRSPAEASLQLSFRYGHFPWLGSRTSAMDEAWRQLSRHDP
jgi:protein tyrosine/serine phosphatase